MYEISLGSISKASSNQLATSRGRSVSVILLSPCQIREELEAVGMVNSVPVLVEIRFCHQNSPPIAFSCFGLLFMPFRMPLAFLMAAPRPELVRSDFLSAS